MQLVIIGSGNVAHFFASCWAKQHQIVQVISRNIQHARKLAQAFRAKYSNSLDEILPDADGYVLAINDDALFEIAANLRLSDHLVVHTSGSVAMDVLAQVSSRHGVIYPLQSIRADIPVRQAFPVLIEASGTDALPQIKQLAIEISPHILEVPTELRKQYHLAAVCSNNFMYHLLAAVKWFCELHGLEFAQLLPLINETIDRIKDYPPFTQQTGPAKRRDQRIIAEHERMLAIQPELLELYRVFTRQIGKHHFHG